MSILTEAEKLVNGMRQAQYNDPVKNFGLIAQIASLITGKKLTAIDCVRVMMAVKLSRQVYRHKEDNLVDLCGYVEIENRIQNYGVKAVIKKFVSQTYKMVTGWFK